jgi:putative ATP-binding cassette transporter
MLDPGGGRPGWRGRAAATQGRWIMRWKSIPPWKPATRLAEGIEPVFPETMTALSLVRRADEHARIAALSAAILGIIVANAIAQVELNAWSRPFYDALERKNFSEFTAQLLVFALIAGILLVLVVAQTWTVEMLKIGLRRALTGAVLDRWLRPNLPYRLGLAGEIGVTPDQRVQEDIRRLTELSADLAAGALQASLLFATFVGVLWALSSDWFS